MTKTPIKTIGRAITCTLPNGDQFLIGQIEIDCPACGTGEFKIAGHHMRSVLRLLAQWVEEYPDLTGPEEVSSVQTETFTGRMGGDPTTN